MPVKARNTMVNCYSYIIWKLINVNEKKLSNDLLTTWWLVKACCCWSSSPIFSLGRGLGGGARHKFFGGGEGKGWWFHKTCYAFPSAVTGSKEREECWESKEIWLAFRGVAALSGVPDCLGVVACLDPEAREDRPVILPSSPPMFEVELRVLLPVSPSGSMLRKVTGRLPSIPKGWFPIRLVLPSLKKT